MESNLPLSGEKPDKKLLFRSGDPSFMTSLARGLEVMRGLSEAPQGAKMPEISRRSGLSRAVVRRCLYTLQQTGYVRIDGAAFFLEPKILSLGHSFLSSISLPAMAQPILERLSREIHESCSLAVLDHDDVVYIARAAAQRIMAVSLGVGSRLPAYCTSLGRALLAQLEPGQLEAHLGGISPIKHTQHSLVTKPELAAVIATARVQGFAAVNEELEIGLRSIAVPVFDGAGGAVAAMNIGVQASRVSASELKTRVLPSLQRAAQELGAKLVR